MKRKKIASLTGATLLALSILNSYSQTEGGISVELGKTINRTFADVEKDKGAYAPKQEFDNTTGYTHIYLPYGNKPELYAEVKGTLVDPNFETGVGKFKCKGPNNGTLTYKINFDKPITEFKFYFNHFEWGLVEGTAAGIEYSTDGKEWKTIKEIKGTKEKDEGQTNNFVKDFKADGLNSQTLYIRFYTRSLKDDSKTGKGRWMQFWLTGSPKWGDAARTFFVHNPQIWVK
ncbi:MAG TPA: hypothetical protein P5270_03110 [Victivallales bacterium]|nr:hypothetical protein [Victivallales bacterium]HRR28326.1 hypothetical protein [Victivallales bacterium]HRU01423.1 hypothetical protein [Victivallales bacterium]